MSHGRDWRLIAEQSGARRRELGWRPARADVFPVPRTATERPYVLGLPVRVTTVRPGMRSRPTFPPAADGDWGCNQSASADGLNWRGDGMQGLLPGPPSVGIMRCVVMGGLIVLTTTVRAGMQSGPGVDSLTPAFLRANVASATGNHACSGDRGRVGKSRGAGE